MTSPLWTGLSLTLALVVALAGFLRAAGYAHRSAAILSRGKRRAATTPQEVLREVLPLAALLGGLFCADRSGLPPSLPLAMAAAERAALEGSRGQAVRTGIVPAVRGAAAAREADQFGGRLLLLALSIPLAQAGLAGVLYLAAPLARGGRTSAAALLTPLLVGAPLTALGGLLFYLWLRSPFRARRKG